MRHRKILALTLCSLLAIAAVASETASAETLPVLSPNTGGTGTSAAGTLFIEGGGLKCTKGKFSFAAATKEAEGKQLNLGTWTDTLEGCVDTLTETPCLSLGDAAGVVLVKGEYHWVILFNGNLGLWLLIAKEDNGEDVHIECPEAATLYLIWGNVLVQHDKTSGVALKTGEKVKEILALLNATAGVQELTEFVNNKGEKVKASLKGKIGTGVERSAAVNSKENKIVFEKETEVLRK